VAATSFPPESVGKVNLFDRVASHPFAPTAGAHALDEPRHLDVSIVNQPVADFIVSVRAAEHRH